MTESLTLASFVEMTRNVASAEEEFVPTFVDPLSRNIVALEGIPPSDDVAKIVRDWASDFGAEHYFIAYPSELMIVAEEYKNGALVDAQDIQPN